MRKWLMVAVLGTGVAQAAPQAFHDAIFTTLTKLYPLPAGEDRYTLFGGQAIVEYVPDMQAVGIRGVVGNGAFVPVAFAASSYLATVWCGTPDKNATAQYFVDGYMSGGMNGTRMQMGRCNTIVYKSGGREVSIVMQRVKSGNTWPPKILK